MELDIFEKERQDLLKNLWSILTLKRNKHKLFMREEVLGANVFHFPEYQISTKTGEFDDI